MFKKSLEELLEPTSALSQVSALMAGYDSVLNVTVNVHDRKWILRGWNKNESLSTGVDDKALAQNTYSPSAFNHKMRYQI